MKSQNRSNTRFCQIFDSNSTFLLLIFIFYYLVCVRILCECMFVHHFWVVVPREDNWQNHIPRKWNYWYLWVNMWVPGIEPKSFGREASPLNCWTICPVCTFIFYKIKRKIKQEKLYIHLPKTNLFCSY